MDTEDELLSRGVDTIYPSREELKKYLQSGEKLRLYQGFDPTGLQMHIGHMVGLRKLAQFQKLGHQVIFLIGDGTGLAGDPSGKTRGREKFLNQEQLRQNAVDYVTQASRIVSFEGDNPVKIRFNGDWLTKLTLLDLLTIAGNFTLQQLSERDMFVDRQKRGEPINMREFLYPLLQGYDSVAMDVDLEIGGTDQTFNMLCGRTLVQNMLQKNKFVLTTPLLTDATGKKIGKTEGNVIALNDRPDELYAKILSLSDDIIIKGLQYLTDLPLPQIEKIAHDLSQGANPMQYKKKLAYEIVSQLHTSQKADSAQETFEKRVQQKELPETVAYQYFPAHTLISYADLLVQTSLASSKSEAKRLIEQGGVEIDNLRIQDPNEEISLTQSLIIKVGKRKFIEVRIKE